MRNPVRSMLGKQLHNASQELLNYADSGCIDIFDKLKSPKTYVYSGYEDGFWLSEAEYKEGAPQWLTTIALVGSRDPWLADELHVHQEVIDTDGFDQLPYSGTIDTISLRGLIVARRTMRNAVKAFED